jgi:hypothetical protein
LEYAVRDEPNAPQPLLHLRLANESFALAAGRASMTPRLLIITLLNCGSVGRLLIDAGHTNKRQLLLVSVRLYGNTAHFMCAVTPLLGFGVYWHRLAAFISSSMTMNRAMACSAAARD